MTIILTDIDECASGRHNCSSLNNWICKNLMPPEKFLCECNVGFMRESDMCEGITFSDLELSDEGHVP